MDKIRSQLPKDVFDEVCRLLKPLGSKVLEGPKKSHQRQNTISYTCEGQNIHMIELNKISAEKKVKISNHLQYRERHPQHIKNFNYLIIMIIVAFIALVYLIIIMLLFL